MVNKDTLTPQELNAIIRTIPNKLNGNPFPAPKQWKQVGCGEIEVYVGDCLFVIAFVDKTSNSEQEIVDNQIRTEDTVIKYLQSEGFLNDEYVYIGMQQFAINLQPPDEKE